MDNNYDNTPKENETSGQPSGDSAGNDSMNLNAGASDDRIRMRDSRRITSSTSMRARIRTASRARIIITSRATVIIMDSRTAVIITASRTRTAAIITIRTMDITIRTTTVIIPGTIIRSMSRDRTRHR